MSIKIIETFSGIGSQAKAFEKIKKKHPDIEYEVVATVEWEIGALYAYDIIHNGKQDLSIYEKETRDDLVNFLKAFNLSSDGKVPIKESTLKRMPLIQLKAIKYSIERNNNLVDISAVRAEELPDADLLTYSFPCQDLSISSYWHNNFSGIEKGIDNRSGLLWEIERILHEYIDIDKKLPRFLLMENVSAIHGPLHNKNFKLWRKELEKMGYKNGYYDLDATDFGIPQSRVRTFMISVYVDDLEPEQVNSVLRFFEITSLNGVGVPAPIGNFLKLDYSSEIYLNEAIQSTPNDTVSRQKIGNGSVVLARGKNPSDTHIAKTITTKQDRYPNAGIILHDKEFGVNKAFYRNLTPRETFLLMGFEEKDFQQLIDNNILVSQSRKMLSHSKLLKLAGNSIVVNILENIFLELIALKETIIDSTSDSLTFENKYL